MTRINLQGIEKDIHNLLYDYIDVKSFSGTKDEVKATKFLTDYFGSIPYFKDNKEMYGTVPIENDPYDREVFWAMVKGEGDDTVVLIHHCDVVGIEDFKALKDYAFSPDELAPQLEKIKDSLSSDARKNLEEGTFLFGKGTADMKGGGSIQISLLERYSQLEDMKGNVLLLAVPDEENLSAGMRRAVTHLTDLKKRYNLNYRLMINSEPHQRKDFSKGVFSTGSVGKVMPFFYVRGYMSHIGKVFEGLNPINIMSTIVKKTELNMDFSDAVENEASPPPTWLYLRDSKTAYDVSMPLSVSGCCSILTLGRSLHVLMDELRGVCEESFDEVIEEMNASYSKFAKITGRSDDKLPWKASVYDFAQLYDEAKASYGDAFEQSYSEKLDSLIIELRDGKKSLIELNFNLIEHIYDYIDDIEPRIVYGMMPPYYPAFSNIFLDNLSDVDANLSEMLEEYTKEEFSEEYETEMFFTGISDLSYAGIKDGDMVLEALEHTMPLYGDFYELPINDLERISMPVINIGPWGKDFHKLTERVSIEDLYDKTPKILEKAISIVLEH